MRGLNHVVLAVCLWLSMVYGDDKTCQEVKGRTANFHPKLPIEFVVDVEMVIYETATVQNMRLYYSTRNKIIRMDITEDQVTSSMYFYYDDGEILVFNYFTGRGKCRVIHDIAKATDDFLFGGLKISDGISQIPAPLAAVHFIGMSGFQNHQIVQRFQGTKTVRGKQANVYTSCQQWTSKGSNVLLNVTHYFADKKYEFPDVKDEATLLSIDVQGVKTSNVKGESDTPIRHRYNYYNMKIGIDNTMDMLETPDGIVCPGRKMDKPFPKLPDRVKLHAESIAHIRKIVVNSEESYNYIDKYAIIKSQPLNTQGSYTTMMDFATDEMYIMSSGKGMCTKVDIKDVPALSELPLYTVNGGKAVMSNPKRFFYADASQFSYLGKKKIRGMLTDTWVAKTKDLANYPNAVIQWHFAPPVKDWNTNHSWAVPMKCIFWPNSQQLDKGITQNIFNADYSHSWMDFYDVSICFKNTKYIRLALNATRADILSTGNELFREEAAVAIARAVGVRPTKVNQMELLYDKGDVYLDFAISDDSDLRNVTDRLRHAVDTGMLTLNVTDNKTNLKRTITVHEVSSPVVVTPTGNPNVTPTGNPNVTPTGNPNTGNPSVNPTGSSKTNGTNKAERDEGTSGYSGGAMAGVGVAMVIVGLAGGSGLGFMHNKYLH